VCQCRYDTEARRALGEEHFQAASAQGGGVEERGCCCNDKKCSLPAKPECCSCCPSAPLDPRVVANAKTHALAAYTGMNR
jgi:hypothetical protein